MDFLLSGIGRAVASAIAFGTSTFAAHAGIALLAKTAAFAFLGGPAGWAVAAVVGIIVAAITFAYFTNMAKQKEDNMAYVMEHDSYGQQQEIIDVEDPATQRENLQQQAMANAGWIPKETLSSNEAKQIADSTGNNIIVQQPTAEEIQAIVNSAAQQDANANKEKFEEILGQLRGSGNNGPSMEDLQAANRFENPFTQTVVEEEDLKEEEIDENLERIQSELDIDKSNFDGLDGYEFMIDNVTVKLYVKSNIELISTDEEFNLLNDYDLETNTYVDAKGQEHAISRAYDKDGKPLDKVIISSQEAYLEYGLNGSFGYAKLTGQGNKDNYTIEGYGENVVAANTKSYLTYFKGDYELKASEVDKKVVLGTNSDKISKKEYKFRDSADIEFSEGDSASLPNAFKAAIIWACDVMREVNIESYVLDFGEAKIIIDVDDNAFGKKEATWKEEGITYTYDKNATITNAQTGATYSIEDVLENEMMTMEELIKKGFKPLTLNGKKFKGIEDLKAAKTALKQSFEIVIDEIPSDLPTKREIFYEDEDGMKYYFIKEISKYYHIVTEDGTEYSLKEVLEDDIYTIEELMDAGLDCKVNQV